MNIHNFFSRNTLHRFWHDEEGQTLVEYGLLISLLALVSILAVTLLGRRVSNMWGNNGEKYPEANNMIAGR